jgi:hypothetical protein
MEVDLLLPSKRTTMVLLFGIRRVTVPAFLAIRGQRCEPSALSLTRLPTSKAIAQVSALASAAMEGLEVR